MQATAPTSRKLAQTTAAVLLIRSSKFFTTTVTRCLAPSTNHLVPVPCCAVLWPCPCCAVLTSRFLTTVVPSASAASSRMRLERLLEPGSFTVPLMVLMGATVSCSTAWGECVVVFGEGGQGTCGCVGVAWSVDVKWCGGSSTQLGCHPAGWQH